MGRFINPFTDWGFKRLFGQEFSKDLLLSFLNELLKDEVCIKDVTFKDKEALAETKDGQGCTYDVYCESDTGEHFIVEMQAYPQTYFMSRSAMYACRAVSTQGRRGIGWDKDLMPVYLVCLLREKPHEALIQQFRTDFSCIALQTGKKNPYLPRLTYLALPYFTKEAEECETLFDCWIYTLKHMETLERVPFETRDKIFKKLAEISQKEYLTKDEYERYEQSVKTLNDHLCEIDYAVKNGMNSVALLMLQDGKTITEISKYTGLSQEEISKLNPA